MTYFLQAILGALVWLVANVVYVDLKRKGIRGFTRFAAFWAGTPTTWISLFAVREGSQPSIDPPPDDEGEALLAEIRRERALNPGDSVTGSTAAPDTASRLEADAVPTSDPEAGPEERLAL